MIAFAAGLFIGLMLGFFIACFINSLDSED